MHQLAGGDPASQHSGRTTMQNPRRGDTIRSCCFKGRRAFWAPANDRPAPDSTSACSARVKVYLPFDWIFSTHSDSGLVDDTAGCRSAHSRVSLLAVSAIR